jgi:hypothetical protein
LQERIVYVLSEWLLVHARFYAYPVFVTQLFEHDSVFGVRFVCGEADFQGCAHVRGDLIVRTITMDVADIQRVGVWAMFFKFCSQLVQRLDQFERSTISFPRP